VSLLCSTRVRIWWRATLVTLLGASSVLFSFALPASATLARSTPSAPLQVKVKAGNASAVIHFRAPTSNGGYKVSYYRVETFPTHQIHRCTTTATCAIRGLTNGAAYSFAVAAINKLGAGPYSATTKRVRPRAPLVRATFNANGGSGAMAPETKRYNTIANLSANTFTLSGYTFSGWNTAANGSGTSFSNRQRVRFKGSSTLYAQWSINAYTISFNTNGGSGAMAPQTENYNVSANLSTNTFTLSGYTFSGWNTAADGSGTSFADAQLFTFTSSALLYAQWSINTYTVTFVANGGSGTMAPQTENYDVSANLSTNTFSRGGYTFSGWNTAADGSGTSYADAQLVTFTVSATLYAQWTLQAPVPAAHHSSNWAGYVVPSSSVILTDVEGSWVVPTLNCADTPSGQMAVWLGSGGSTGASSDSLLQTGTSASCVNGAQQNYAWWEIVPATPNHEQTFSNFSVSPGDQINAAVFQTTSGAWESRVSDVNTGLSAYMITGQSWGVGPTSSGTFSIQGSAAGFSYSGAYSAEWIVEDETSSSTQGLVPFANFGSVTFSNLATSLTTWSLNQSETWAMVQNTVTLATPTTTTTDGFSVGYTGP